MYICSDTQICALFITDILSLLMPAIWKQKNRLLHKPCALQHAFLDSFDLFTSLQYCFLFFKALRMHSIFLQVALTRSFEHFSTKIKEHASNNKYQDVFSDRMRKGSAAWHNGCVVSEIWIHFLLFLSWKQSYIATRPSCTVSPHWANTCCGCYNKHSGSTLCSGALYS